MKKLFLFLTGALLSLGLSATEYDVVINKANIDTQADNNLEFTNQLPAGTFLKAGDVINFTLKGFFSAPATVQLNAIAANDYDADGAGGYWYMLSDWLEAKAPQAEVGTEYSYSTSIPITTDALTNGKYIIQVAFGLGMKDKKTYGTTFKIRPTAAELEANAQTYSVEVPTILFGPDSPTGATNFKAEVAFTTEAAMAEDDILEVTFNGKFNQAINGLVFMVFDKDGNTILPWCQQTTFQAVADETINTTLQLTIPANCPTTDAKLAVFIEGYVEGIEYKFLKDGDVEHDPVEVAKKDYTNVTMSYNQYATPANYQFIDAAIASDVQVGDYITFSVTGTASAAFGKMIAYVRNASYSAISNQVVVAENIAADGSVSYSGMIEITAAAASCDLVFEITDEATEGASITIGEGGGSQDAVEEVSAVAFENGVVYSAGQIVVYNVAGQIEATASQQFDTKSLNGGVYFITAPEGTIKIQK